MAADPAQGSSGAGLRFAPLGPRDADALGDLFERNRVPEVTRHFHPFPLTRGTAKGLAADPGRDRYFGAWSDGRLVGLAMLRGWNEGFEVPSFGIIVDAACHGRGIGRWLTERTCQEATALGCTRVRLSVYASNERARGLYHSVGFFESGRVGTEVDGRADERITMELGLAVLSTHVGDVGGGPLVR